MPATRWQRGSSTRLSGLAAAIGEMVRVIARAAKEGLERQAGRWEEVERLLEAHWVALMEMGTGRWWRVMWDGLGRRRDEKHEER